MTKRTFEAIDGRPRGVTEVPLAEIGGRPEWFARAGRYQHAAFRRNGAAYLRVTADNSVQPAHVRMRNLDASVGWAGLLPGGEIWYEVRHA